MTDNGDRTDFQPYQLNKALREFLLLFVLDSDNHPVPIDDPLMWAQWMREARVSERLVVAYDRVDELQVSTVFLGVNVNPMSGIRRGARPQLFETMVFGQQGDPEACQRYCTWAEAVDGHAEALKYLQRPK